MIRARMSVESRSFINAARMDHRLTEQCRGPHQWPKNISAEADIISIVNTRRKHCLSLLVASEFVDSLTEYLSPKEPSMIATGTD